MRRGLRSLIALMATGAAFAGGVAVGITRDRDHRGSDSVIDEAAARIAQSSVDDISEQRLDDAAVQGMLSALGDKWASYYTPGDYDQLQALLSGSYSGLGVWLRRSGSGETLVASVLPQSPAAAAGLTLGDQLLSVDDVSTHGEDLGTIVSRLRGPSGSRVTVVVDRDDIRRALTLTRAPVSDQDVTMDYVAPSVARIRVAAFTRGVGAAVVKDVALARKAHVQGIVLDLRGDPGGLLDEGVAVAGAFLDGGTVVSYTEKGQATQVLDAPRGGDTVTPLAVLVDGGTASASEVVAGALQDRGRAIIVGAQTFGKGSVQEPIQLSDGSAIEITVGRYYTPNGHSLDGKGITPDIVLPGNVDEAVAVRRAVDVLQGLLADASGVTTGQG